MTFLYLMSSTRVTPVSSVNPLFGARRNARFLSTSIRSFVTRPSQTSSRCPSGRRESHHNETERTDDLPSREYGYRSTPFSWAELDQIIRQKRHLAKLCRSVQDERHYGERRKEILEEYETMLDHILHSKFNIPIRFDDGTQRWKANIPKRTTGDHEAWSVLLPNDFPYFTEAGIEHWVLWKLFEQIREADVDRAIADLREKLGDVQDTICWENPPHLKSLPDINHVHILVRREGNCSSGTDSNTTTT